MSRSVSIPTGASPEGCGSVTITSPTCRSRISAMASRMDVRRSTVTTRRAQISPTRMTHLLCPWLPGSVASWPYGPDAFSVRAAFPVHVHRRLEPGRLQHQQIAWQIVHHLLRRAADEDAFQPVPRHRAHDDHRGLHVAVARNRLKRIFIGSTAEQVM